MRIKQSEVLGPRNRALRAFEPADPIVVRSDLERCGNSSELSLAIDASLNPMNFIIHRTKTMSYRPLIMICQIFWSSGPVQITIPKGIL